MNGVHKTFCTSINSEEATPLQKVAEIIERQITARCNARVSNDEGAFRIHLSIDDSLKEEEYRLSTDNNQEIYITGGCRRGVLYGAGKFLRTSRYDQGGFTPGQWRGQSSPECTMRAMYLASHFHNFYEDAPFEKIETYVQELGLWGYNTIFIHYPTSHLTGIDDPESQRWFKQFKAVFRAAKSCGLQVGLGQVANQCFLPAPPELAFTKMSGQSNFGEAVCISKPAGRDLVIKVYRQFLEEFREIGLDYVNFGPYDDGGCGCDDCWPWGSKGFVTIARELTFHIKEIHPNCRIILHTWCFESESDEGALGEWEGLDARLREDGGWVDYIMADGHDDYFPAYPLEKGVPGNLPLVNFPEISMFGTFPWGGYGANPAPEHFQKLWNRIKQVAQGGTPYSEGIYEDLNKAIIAGFYWDKNRDARDIVREYAAFEFGPDVVDKVLEVVGILEGNLNRHFIKENSLRAFYLAQQVDVALTEQARVGWRWRIIYLRCLIDKEMYEHPEQITETLNNAFKELTAIYHAENADGRVKPLEGKLNTTGQLSTRHSPFIKSWLISSLQPSTELSSLESGTLADDLGWRPFVVPWFMVENDFICTHDLFGAEDGLVYLANTFEVEQGSEWILHLGHDGGAKVFVNGVEVICAPERINPAPLTRSQASIYLEAGTNEIVVAFDTDHGNGWGIYFCFERPAYTPEDIPFPRRLENTAPLVRS